MTVIQDSATGGQHRARLPGTDFRQRGAAFRDGSSGAGKGVRLSGMDSLGRRWRGGHSAERPLPCHWQLWILLARPLEPHQSEVIPTSVPVQLCGPREQRWGTACFRASSLRSSEVMPVKCLAHSEAVSSRDPELSPDPGSCSFFWPHTSSFTHPRLSAADSCPT